MQTGGAQAGEAAGGQARIARLPRHLLRHVVPQEYERYTPQDHAVWRYVLRQSVRVHAERAHPVYLEGLRRTGISTDRIPRIEEMNDILARLGWAAVTVDGFIPPAAFMEFQAHRVLVIAADMRQVDHLAYTPAPDIVHEAAGHAPIIADPTYAEYLRRVGEVGARALSSRADLALYEAIRRLSRLKEERGADPAEVARAEREVAERQRELGEPSEIALVSRIHWWTVEYGLVGTLERPRLYGAGLLSSLGEAVSCLEPAVRKLPYGIEAASYAYDITRPQPQLFVTPDFEHLDVVLDQLAAGLAQRVGGPSGLAKAAQSEGVATATWSSGLQVSGVFAPPRLDAHGRLAYVRTTGPSALAYEGAQLAGHGRDRHPDGFGAPVGRLRGIAAAPEELDDGARARLGLVPGGEPRLELESGVTVSGRVSRVERRAGKTLLATLTGCRVAWGDELLFRPEWGEFDLVLGERVSSVCNGAADQDAFEEAPPPARRRARPHAPGDGGGVLQELYARARSLREGGAPVEEVAAIWAAVRVRHPGDWLLPLELLEILEQRRALAALAAEIRAVLEARAREPGLERLLGEGLRCAADGGRRRDPS